MIRDQGSGCRVQVARLEPDAGGYGWTALVENEDTLSFYHKRIMISV